MKLFKAIAAVAMLGASAITGITILISTSSAAEAGNYLPCHMLPTQTPADTPCFDDTDRDGKFQYERGDRAYEINGWRQYQFRGLNMKDGQYTGFSKQRNIPVFVVIRNGWITSANFGRISGCDSSNPNWSCGRVEASMKKIGQCELRWTIPWEEDFSYQVDIKNYNCNQ